MPHASPSAVPPKESVIPVKTEIHRPQPRASAAMVDIASEAWQSPVLGCAIRRASFSGAGTGRVGICRRKPGVLSMFLTVCGQMVSERYCLRCHPLSRTRFVQGDSRRQKLNLSKVRNFRVPHLPPGERRQRRSAGAQTIRDVRGDSVETSKTGSRDRTQYAWPSPPRTSYRGSMIDRMMSPKTPPRTSMIKGSKALTTTSTALFTSPS